MIKKALRILLVEDIETDAELISRHIHKIVESPVIQVVDNLEDCNRELHNFVPDIVLSDYNLPTCTGLDILELSRSTDETIPFIFLTGAVEDDELAENTVIAGASGYILKKDMKVLQEKLRPIFKQIVFKMGNHDEIRNEVRRSKIATNQIYNYLDQLKTENKEQKDYLDNLRKNDNNTGLNGDDE